MSRHRRAAAAVLAVLTLPAAGAAEDLPCRVDAALEPLRAVIGQQVLYRLGILTHHSVVSVDWVTPPSFPGFRAEPLPGRPADSVREEHRALFPERAGVLPIRLDGVRCRLRDGGEVVAPVPEVALTVEPPPDQGRPAGFGGLVGPLFLRARVEPRRVALGGSVRVELGLRGGGNLWDAPDPLADVSLPGGAEVFRERPELTLEPGPQLFVRRDFRYDVVPRRAGVLWLPPVRVDYFDPETRRYAVAGAPAVRVQVIERPPAALPRQGPAADPAAPPSGRAGPIGMAAALAVAGLVALAVLWMRRRR